MYTIAGATGQVGSATAERLLAAGHPVRVLIRDPAKAASYSERGAEVVVVELGDRQGLTEALRGSSGFFAMLPFELDVADFHADTARLREAMVAAVVASGVPHVVMLSSIGADLPSDTGPIVELHHLEEQLRATSTTVTALRSPHFQEKVTEVVDVVRNQGIYPVFGPADVALPMVATRDIGEVAARALTSPPSRSEVVDLDGPAYTERELAAQLGAALGLEPEVVELSEEVWGDVLVDAGFPPHIAEVLVALHTAGARGLLVPRGDRVERCVTPVQDTLQRLFAVSVR